MRAATRITSVYIRKYRNNGQETAYVEWSDGSRTEAPLKCPCCGRKGWGAHMQALMDAAKCQGLTIGRETW